MTGRPAHTLQGSRDQDGMRRLRLIEAALSKPVSTEELASWLAEAAASLGGRRMGLALCVEGQPIELAQHSVAPPWEHDPKWAVSDTSNPSLVGGNSNEIAWLPLRKEPGDWQWSLWLERACGVATPDWNGMRLLGLALLEQLEQGESASKLQKARDARDRRISMETIRPVVDRLVHDFNNVLTTLQGFTELSQEDLPKEHKVQRNLLEMLNATTTAAEFQLQVSRFTRRFVPRGMPAEIASVVQSEAQRLLLEPGSQALDVAMDIANELPEVTLPDEGLRLVLAHLFQNAAQAMRQSGMITVCATPITMDPLQALGVIGPLRAGNFVCLRIRDQGIGFTKEARTEAFASPFYSTRPRHRGMGFAIIYGILSYYRSGLQLESTSDQGTTMALYLATP